MACIERPLHAPPPKKSLIFQGLKRLLRWHAFR
jgi:hypothetical protein